MTNYFEGYHQRNRKIKLHNNGYIRSDDELKTSVTFLML